MATLRRRFTPEGSEEQATGQLVNDLQKPLGLPFLEGVLLEKTVLAGGTTYDVEHGLNRVPRGYIVLDLTGTIGYPIKQASTEATITFGKGLLTSGSLKVWVF